MYLGVDVAVELQMDLVSKSSSCFLRRMTSETLSLALAVGLPAGSVGTGGVAAGAGASAGATGVLGAGAALVAVRTVGKAMNSSSHRFSRPVDKYGF